MANEEDNGVEGSEVEGDQNKTQNEEQQGPEIQEKQPSNIEASSEGEVESNKSKTRGPTLCAKVHGRIFEEREQIIFNANWQPIGPSDQALSNFSSFLGTIARTHVYCPLTYNSWKELLKTRREEIWDYVNSKYILHAQAERYVMKTINEAWRIHKCRVKSSHFTKYRTDAERLKNRPLSIPETQFKKLIKYWKTEKVKKLSEMNTTNRALQKWPHRVGPTSFARIRERLRASKENHDSPSQAEIFVTTRRGNERKQLDAETSNKINQLEILTSSGQDTTSAFQSLFGVEKHGQVRCYGRNVTLSTLKRNVEMKVMRKEVKDNELKKLQPKVEGLTTFIQDLVQRNPNLNIDATALSSLLGTSPIAFDEENGLPGDVSDNDVCDQDEEEEGDDECNDEDETSI